MKLAGKTINLIGAIIFLLALGACADADNDAEFTGYVEAEWSYIAAPQSGWLVSSRIQEGDTVAAGQVLFELDKQQQQARLAEAIGRSNQAGAQARDIESGARPSELRALQAALEQAQSILDRAVKERRRILPLVEKGIESASRAELVESNYRIANASVTAAKEAIITARLSGREQALKGAAAAHDASLASQAVVQWQLDQRTVRSLISGRVEEIFYKPGEYVRAGAAVVALLPENGLKIRFYVPQASLSSLSKGQSVAVTHSGSDDTINARINYLATSAEYTPPYIYSIESRSKLVFLVEAMLPPGTSLNPGLPVDISL